MTRDRDGAGRPRNARARDALGRPLSRVAGVAPPVDEPALAPDDALRRAQRLLDEGEAFRAHEVLEAVWKQTHGDERDLWRGLAQLCVGVTHAQRGNSRGASALFARAAATLAGHEDDRTDVAVAALRTWAQHAAEEPTTSPPQLLADSGG
jgi:hypothetical protein